MDRALCTVIRAVCTPKTLVSKTTSRRNFWRNGHSVKIIVFDDSRPTAQEKYYSLLEQTRTHNEVFYVGSREKEEFQGYLNGRLHDKRLAGLVKNLQLQP
jgi:hypothetical protein